MDDFEIIEIDNSADKIINVAHSEYYDEKQTENTNKNINTPNKKKTIEKDLSIELKEKNDIYIDKNHSIGSNIELPKIKMPKDKEVKTSLNGMAMDPVISKAVYKVNAMKFGVSGNSSHPNKILTESTITLRGKKLRSLIK